MLSHSLHNFLIFINSLHDNIKYTMEVEENGTLPFLDILIYRKPDWSLGHWVIRNQPIWPYILTILLKRRQYCPHWFREPELFLRRHLYLMNCNICMLCLGLMAIRNVRFIMLWQEVLVVLLPRQIRDVANTKLAFAPFCGDVSLKIGGHVEGWFVSRVSI